ncbi:hypothetical protein B4168_0419 [Anoxybacillus flavithermus]|nr:hypothetical protein B4168_0419 [Anoxybacillus flavithermus]OAO89005.1 hypothetical protein GT23_0025 [Parageobacillus thermoglucosidasius]
MAAIIAMMKEEAEGRLAMFAVAHARAVRPKVMRRSALMMLILDVTIFSLLFHCENDFNAVK